MKVTLRMPKILIDQAKQICSEKFEAPFETVIKQLTLYRLAQQSIKKMLEIYIGTFPPEDIEIEFQMEASEELKKAIQDTINDVFLDWLAEEIFWKRNVSKIGEGKT